MRRVVGTLISLIVMSTIFAAGVTPAFAGKGLSFNYDSGLTNPKITGNQTFNGSVTTLCTTAGGVLPPPSGGTTQPDALKLYNDLTNLWAQYNVQLSQYNSAEANWQLKQATYAAAQAANPLPNPMPPNPGPQPTAPIKPPYPQATAVQSYECPPPPTCGGNGAQQVEVFPEFTGPGVAPHTATFNDPFTPGEMYTTPQLAKSVTNPDAYNQLYTSITYFPETGLNATGENMLGSFPAGTGSSGTGGLSAGCYDYGVSGTSHCVGHMAMAGSGPICWTDPNPTFTHIAKPSICLNVPSNTAPCSTPPTTGLSLHLNVAADWPSGTIALAPYGPSQSGGPLPGYVNVPVCGWLQGDAIPATDPTYSHTWTQTEDVPGPYGTIIASMNLHVVITPGPITWTWGDGTSTMTNTYGVNPYVGSDLPAYDAATGMWTYGGCSTGSSHKYTTVTTGSNTYTISVTQKFYVSEYLEWTDGYQDHYYYLPAGGSGITWDKKVETITWTSVKERIEQIESVPYS